MLLWGGQGAGGEVYFRGKFLPSGPFNNFPNGNGELDASHSAPQILFSALIL